MDILGWIARLSQSKGLSMFNKIWMVLTLIMIGLMVAGNYFQLGNRKSSPENAANITAPKPKAETNP